ncbi:MAG: 16S rRNA (guanine(527)-N(7))-methyltransferase RsmG [Pseudomonadota bacterium]
MMSTPAQLEGYVSRETIDQLNAYVSLLQKWNPKINLVSKSQVHDLWHRHIWDSAQIWPHLCDTAHHIDLGSGGGLPGLVLAVFCKQHSPSVQVSLVESDIRKAVFLRTVARELSLNVRVHDKRHQFVPPAHAASMTARALSSLSELLGAAERHLAFDGVAVFPKGQSWREEVEAARASWTFDLEVIPSITDPNAALLKIKEIRRV